jgi:hypothetical protein
MQPVALVPNKPQDLQDRVRMASGEAGHGPYATSFGEQLHDLHHLVGRHAEMA